MFYSISGILQKKVPGLAVIDVQGIGFELTISLATYEALPTKGGDCRLFTYLHVREDILQLFGFAAEDEKDVFLKLISLSGIGPKNAMNILSAISVGEFRKVVANGDFNRLKALPGIGPKTAKRLLLELKEKMDESEVADVLGGDPAADSPKLRDAYAALESLGFRKSEVQKSLEALLKEEDALSTEDLVRRVLKQNKANNR